MNIKTTDLDKFLEAEWIYYKAVYDSFDEFKTDMSINVHRCENCNVCFWEGCNKRCSCK